MFEMVSQSINAILEGFTFVESDGVPSITLDNQRRFYVNTSARRLMDLRPYERLSVAYNPIDKALAFVKGNADPTSVYNIDKRYYMSARHFARTYAFEPAEAPFTFVYDRGSSGGSVFIFSLLINN